MWAQLKRVPWRVPAKKQLIPLYRMQLDCLMSAEKTSLRIRHSGGKKQCQTNSSNLLQGKPSAKTRITATRKVTGWKAAKGPKRCTFFKATLTSLLGSSWFLSARCLGHWVDQRIHNSGLGATHGRIQLARSMSGAALHAALFLVRLSYRTPINPPCEPQWKCRTAYFVAKIRLVGNLLQPVFAVLGPARPEPLKKASQPPALARNTAQQPSGFYQS